MSFICKKGIPTALTVLYFLTHCVFIHAAEINFWNERKKASGSTRQAPSQMAALPHLPVHFLGNITSKVNPSQFQTLSGSPENNSNPSLFLDQSQGLDLAALLPYGTIRKVRRGLSGHPHLPMVLHIQDIHKNHEAQSNIGKAIRTLVENNQTPLVALEGSSGEIDLTAFRIFPDQVIVKKTADYLLKNGGISGPIHALMTLPSPWRHSSKENSVIKSNSSFPKIMGIDDEAHHAANVANYLAAAPLQKKLKEDLEQKISALELEKEKRINSELLKFDRAVGAFRNAEMPLGTFVRELAKGFTNEPAGSSQQQINNFLEVIHLESTLDFKQVERERDELLSVLASRLSAEESRLFRDQCIRVRLGHLGLADFYSTLQQICALHHVNNSKWEMMETYLRYLFLSRKIDPEELFEEMRKTEESIYSALIKTEEEKTLIQKSRYLYLVGKLVDFSLTKEEWEEYKAVVPGTRKNNSFLAPTANYENFYHEAERRDQKMAENFLKAVLGDSCEMDKFVPKGTVKNAVAPACFWPGPRFSSDGEPGSRPKDCRDDGLKLTFATVSLGTKKVKAFLVPSSQHQEQSIAVLVTGGFHSDGINRLLEKAGLTVVDFVPRVTRVEGETGPAYLSAFAQEKTPLDKLFEGQKLFLAEPGISFAAFNRGLILILAEATAKGTVLFEYLWVWGWVFWKGPRRLVLRSAQRVKKGALLTFDSSRSPGRKSGVTSSQYFSGDSSPGKVAPLYGALDFFKISADLSPKQWGHLNLGRTWVDGGRRADQLSPRGGMWPWLRHDYTRLAQEKGAFTGTVLAPLGKGSIPVVAGTLLGGVLAGWGAGLPLGSVETWEVVLSFLGFQMMVFSTLITGSNDFVPSEKSMDKFTKGPKERIKNIWSQCEAQVKNGFNLTRKKFEEILGRCDPDLIPSFQKNFSDQQSELWFFPENSNLTPSAIRIYALALEAIKLHPRKNPDQNMAHRNQDFKKLLRENNIEVDVVLNLINQSEVMSLLKSISLSGVGIGDNEFTQLMNDFQRRNSIERDEEQNNPISNRKQGKKRWRGAASPAKTEPAGQIMQVQIAAAQDQALNQKLNTIFSKVITTRKEDENHLVEELNLKPEKEIPLDLNLRLTKSDGNSNPANNALNLELIFRDFIKKVLHRIAESKISPKKKIGLGINIDARLEEKSISLYHVEVPPEYQFPIYEELAHCFVLRFPGVRTRHPFVSPQDNVRDLLRLFNVTYSPTQINDFGGSFDFQPLSTMLDQQSGSSSFSFQIRSNSSENIIQTHNQLDLEGKIPNQVRDINGGPHTNQTEIIQQGKPNSLGYVMAQLGLWGAWGRRHTVGMGWLSMGLEALGLVLFSSHLLTGSWMTVFVNPYAVSFSWTAVGTMGLLLVAASWLHTLLDQFRKNQRLDKSSLPRGDPSFVNGLETFSHHLMGFSLYLAPLFVPALALVLPSPLIFTALLFTAFALAILFHAAFDAREMNADRYLLNSRGETFDQKWNQVIDWHVKDGVEMSHPSLQPPSKWPMEDEEKTIEQELTFYSLDELAAVFMKIARDSESSSLQPYLANNENLPSKLRRYLNELSSDSDRLLHVLKGCLSPILQLKRYFERIRKGEITRSPEFIREKEKDFADFLLKKAFIRELMRRWKKPVGSHLFDAPDQEFLRVFYWLTHPYEFMWAHKGQAWQTKVRLAALWGLHAFLWITPFMGLGFAWVWAVPLLGFWTVLFVWWQISLIFVFRWAQTNPHQPLSWSWKLVVWPVYVAQFVGHALYNLPAHRWGVDLNGWTERVPFNTISHCILKPAAEGKPEDSIKKINEIVDVVEFYRPSMYSLTNKLIQIKNSLSTDRLNQIVISQLITSLASALQNLVKGYPEFLDDVMQIVEFSPGSAEDQKKMEQILGDMLRLYFVYPEDHFRIKLISVPQGIQSNPISFVDTCYRKIWIDQQQLKVIQNLARPLFLKEYVQNQDQYLTYAIEFLILQHLLRYLNFSESDLEKIGAKSLVDVKHPKNISAIVADACRWAVRNIASDPRGKRYQAGNYQAVEKLKFPEHVNVGPRPDHWPAKKTQAGRKPNSLGFALAQLGLWGAWGRRHAVGVGWVSMGLEALGLVFFASHLLTGSWMGVLVNPYAVSFSWTAVGTMGLLLVAASWLHTLLDQFRKNQRLDKSSLPRGDPSFVNGLETFSHHLMGFSLYLAPLFVPALALVLPFPLISTALLFTAFALAILFHAAFDAREMGKGSLQPAQPSSSKFFPKVRSLGVSESLIRPPVQNQNINFTNFVRNLIGSPLLSALPLMFAAGLVGVMDKPWVFIVLSLLATVEFFFWMWAPFDYREPSLWFIPFPWMVGMANSNPETELILNSTPEEKALMARTMIEHLMNALETFDEQAKVEALQTFVDRVDKIWGILAQKNNGEESQFIGIEGLIGNVYKLPLTKKALLVDQLLNFLVQTSEHFNEVHAFLISISLQYVYEDIIEGNSQVAASFSLNALEKLKEEQAVPFFNLVLKNPNYLTSKMGVGYWAYVALGKFIADNNESNPRITKKVYEMALDQLENNLNHASSIPMERIFKVLGVLTYSLTYSSLREFFPRIKRLSENKSDVFKQTFVRGKKVAIELLAQTAVDLHQQKNVEGVLDSTRPSEYLLFDPDAVELWPDLFMSYQRHSLSPDEWEYHVREDAKILVDAYDYTPVAEKERLAHIYGCLHQMVLLVHSPLIADPVSREAALRGLSSVMKEKFRNSFAKMIEAIKSNDAGTSEVLGESTTIAAHFLLLSQTEPALASAVEGALVEAIQNSGLSSEHLMAVLEYCFESADFLLTDGEVDVSPLYIRAFVRVAGEDATNPAHQVILDFFKERFDLKKSVEQEAAAWKAASDKTLLSGLNTVWGKFIGLLETVGKLSDPFRSTLKMALTSLSLTPEELSLVVEQDIYTALDGFPKKAGALDPSALLLFSEMVAMYRILSTEHRTNGDSHLADAIDGGLMKGLNRGETERAFAFLPQDVYGLLLDMANDFWEVGNSSMALHLADLVCRTHVTPVRFEVLERAYAIRYRVLRTKISKRAKIFHAEEPFVYLSFERLKDLGGTTEEWGSLFQQMVFLVGNIIDYGNIDDARLVRELIRKIIERYPGIEVALSPEMRNKLDLLDLYFKVRDGIPVTDQELSAVELIYTQLNNWSNENERKSYEFYRWVYFDLLEILFRNGDRRIDYDFLIEFYRRARTHSDAISLAEGNLELIRATREGGNMVPEEQTPLARLALQKTDGVIHPRLAIALKNLRFFSLLFLKEYDQADQIADRLINTPLSDEDWGGLEQAEHQQLGFAMKSLVCATQHRLEEAKGFLLQAFQVTILDPREVDQLSILKSFNPKQLEILLPIIEQLMKRRDWDKLTPLQRLSFFRFVYCAAPDFYRSRSSEWKKHLPSQWKHCIPEFEPSRLVSLEHSPIIQALRPRIQDTLDQLERISNQANANIKTEISKYKSGPQADPQALEDQLVEIGTEYHYSTTRLNPLLELANALGMGEALERAWPLVRVPFNNFVPGSYTVFEQQWPLYGALRRDDVRSGIMAGVSLLQREGGPKNTHLHRNFAWACELFRQGKWTDPKESQSVGNSILEILTRFVSQGENEFLPLIGNIQWMLGRNTDAEKSFQRALLNRPDDRDVQQHLAELRLVQPGKSLQERFQLISHYMPLAFIEEGPSDRKLARLGEILQWAESDESGKVDIRDLMNRGYGLTIVKIASDFNPDHQIMNQVFTVLERLSNYFGRNAHQVPFAIAVLKARQTGDFGPALELIERIAPMISTEEAASWKIIVADQALIHGHEIDEVRLKRLRSSAVRQLVMFRTEHLPARYKAEFVAKSLIQSSIFFGVFLAVLQERLVEYGASDQNLSPEELGQMVTVASLLPGLEVIEILDRACLNPKFPQRIRDRIVNAKDGLLLTMQTPLTGAEWEHRIEVMAPLNPDRAVELLAMAKEVDRTKLERVIAEWRGKAERRAKVQEILKRALGGLSRFDFELVQSLVKDMNPDELNSLDPQGAMVADYDRLTGDYRQALEKAWISYQEGNWEDVAHPLSEAKRSPQHKEARSLEIHMEAVRSLQARSLQREMGPLSLLDEIKKSFSNYPHDLVLSRLKVKAEADIAESKKHENTARENFTTHEQILKSMPRAWKRKEDSGNRDKNLKMGLLWNQLVQEFRRALELNSENTPLCNFLLNTAEGFIATGRKELDQFGRGQGRFAQAQDLAYVVYAQAQNKTYREKAMGLRDQARRLEVYRSLIQHARILSTKLDADLHRTQRSTDSSEQYDPKSVVFTMEGGDWDFDHQKNQLLVSSMRVEQMELFQVPTKVKSGKPNSKPAQPKKQWKTLRQWTLVGGSTAEALDDTNKKVRIADAPMVSAPSEYRFVWSDGQGKRWVVHAQYRGYRSGQGLEFSMDKREADSFAPAMKHLKSQKATVNYSEDIQSHRQLNALNSATRELEPPVRKGDFSSNPLTLPLLNRLFGFDLKPETPPSSVTPFQFENTDLEKDPAQKQTLESIVSGQPSVCLVQGPPGAGKTTLIEEMVRQSVKRGEIVIVTNQSNFGLDNVGKKLMGSDLPENKTDRGPVPFIRTGSDDRKIDPVLTQYHSHAQRLDRLMRLIEKHSKTAQGFVYLATNNGLVGDRQCFALLKRYLESGSLAETRVLYDRWTMNSLERSQSANGNGQPKQDGKGPGAFGNQTFDRIRPIVIQEEASMADTAETLIPINELEPKQLVIVGDPKQLPAAGMKDDVIDEIYVEETYGFDSVWPLEEIYSTEAKRGQRISPLENAFNHAQRWGGLPIYVLKVLRRGHWALSVFNQVFYGGLLRHRNFDGPLEVLEPDTYMIIDLDKKENAPVQREEKVNDSWVNIMEAKEVVKAAAYFLKKGKKPEDILILSPYTGQNKLIHQLLFMTAVFNDVREEREVPEAQWLEALEIAGRVFENSFGASITTIRKNGQSNSKQGLQQLMERFYGLGSLVFRGQNMMGVKDVPAMPTLEDEEKRKRDIEPESAVELRGQPVFKLLTVDAAQGQESDVVIFSTTRSNREGRIGFLGEEEGLKRVNVAISRPQENMVLIGCFQTLVKGGRYTFGGSPFGRIKEAVTDNYRRFNTETRQLDDHETMQELGLRPDLRVPWEVLEHVPDKILSTPEHKSKTASLRKAFGLSTGNEAVDAVLDLLVLPVLETVLPFWMIGYGLVDGNRVLLIVGVLTQLLALPLLHHVTEKSRAERSLHKDLQLFALLMIIYFFAAWGLMGGGVSTESALQLAMIPVAFLHLINNANEYFKEVFPWQFWQARPEISLKTDRDSTDPRSRKNHLDMRHLRSRISAA
ncbi:MAG: hypothetical protein KCHDKBKB_02726 [Elusimicrobia bacterium]|nr:hypothetical protein [Elusimicrobiota bacterium]